MEELVAIIIAGLITAIVTTVVSLLGTRGSRPGRRAWILAISILVLAIGTSYSMGPPGRVVIYCLVGLVVFAVVFFTKLRPAIRAETNDAGAPQRGEGDSSPHNP
jgi:hypothetical protein